MTKENYMALEDFQSLWTNALKPFIIGGFDSVEMDDETGDISISYDDGTVEEEEEE